MNRIESVGPVALLALCAALSSAAASAHARLVVAEPAANATVAAPVSIRLRFSEALAKGFSRFTLTDAQGKPVALTASGNTDARTLLASPMGALAPGRYTVSWTAVASDDGHRTSGRYQFLVR